VINDYDFSDPAEAEKEYREILLRCM